MGIWVLGIVLIWLAIVSWFDLKKREVPHTAWVIVPLVCAAIYQAMIGDWRLSFLTVVVALTSERQRLANLTELELESIFFWVPFLFAGCYLAGSHNPIGAIAIVSFWVAWELRCWGGADAVASIALVLIWPDLKLIFALLAVHALVAGFATIVTLLKEHKLRLHHLPGLPMLFFSVLLRSLFTG
jgi:Flp pilus assembly protein protease CpaA